MSADDVELDRILNAFDAFKEYEIANWKNRNVSMLGREEAKKAIQAHYARKQLEQRKGTQHCEDIATAWCEPCLEKYYGIKLTLDTLNKEGEK